MNITDKNLINSSHLNPFDMKTRILISPYPPVEDDIIGSIWIHISDSGSNVGERILGFYYFDGKFNNGELISKWYGPFIRDYNETI